MAAALHGHVTMPVGRRVRFARPLRALLHATHCGDLEAAMAMAVREAAHGKGGVFLYVAPPTPDRLRYREIFILIASTPLC